MTEADTRTEAETKVATPRDPLARKPEPDAGPDRVFYATGVLLDAEDFQAEQLYHRGRLARALSYTQGSGTVAGLGVAWEGTDEGGQLVDRIVVEPGMAIDGVGRIIEVKRPACIRLQPWYDWYASPPRGATALALDAWRKRSADLRASYREGVTITPDVLTRQNGQWTIEAGAEEDEATINGVVVDVFLRFVVCERGKTPAFAAGPFDATDAAQPSRLRDGYEVKLVLRPRATAQPDDNADLDLLVPEPAWPTLEDVSDPAERERRLQDVILGRWRERPADWTEEGPLGGREHPIKHDPTAVFLARTVWPATMPASPVDVLPLPERVDPATEAGHVRVDNHLRSFVYTAGALARVLSWTIPQPVERRLAADMTRSPSDSTTTPTPPGPGSGG